MNTMDAGLHQRLLSSPSTTTSAVVGAGVCKQSHNHGDYDLVSSFFDQAVTSVAGIFDDNPQNQLYAAACYAAVPLQAPICGGIQTSQTSYPSVGGSEFENSTVIAANNAYPAFLPPLQESVESTLLPTVLSSTTLASLDNAKENSLLCQKENTILETSTASTSGSSLCNGSSGVLAGFETNNNGQQHTGELTQTSQLQLQYRTCFHCHESITDKWMLVVNNTSWHIPCLKCASCSTSLTNSTTCFWRENQTYCKSCYNSQFVEATCSACQRSIGTKDWVRRAREFVYHLACFACSHCKRQLSTGEEFSLTDNRLLCKQHYLELIHGHCKTKTKRVRTTFAEEQLSVLQAHFQIDSNPDGADLEKIATITGLSKRVTQVWFQNSRARQKKYQGVKKPRLTGSMNANGQVGGPTSTTSGRSSSMCSQPTSPSGSIGGMSFPGSVTVSCEEDIKPHLVGSNATGGGGSEQQLTACYD